MRQDRSERSFLHCLNRIRLGFCSKVSEVSIKGLSRNLEDSLRREATHIFPQSEGVICQLKRSAQVARWVQQARGHWSRRDSWYWRPYSVSGRERCHVKTGLQGVDVVELNWQKLGNKGLETGSIMGSRKQFPVAAMSYAITCHKSQGLTLPEVVLHSSKEFVAGLTYVACTRIKTFNYLGFDESQLLKPKEESVNVCNDHCEPGDNTSCCIPSTFWRRLLW